MAYDLLKERMPNRCDQRYLEVLEMAAKEGEARVEDALRQLLGSERGSQIITDKEAVKQFLERCEQAPAISGVPIPEVSLTSFDQLLSAGGVQ